MSHVKAVAKIVPVVEDQEAAERARSALIARLRAQRPLSVGRWKRDELYDDTP